MFSLWRLLCFCFVFSVTSSEKVDKENRYVDFTIISLPYPGCEFFREFRENDYTAQGLIFDWSQGHVDANIGVPEDPITAQLKIEWDNYKVNLQFLYSIIFCVYIADT